MKIITILLLMISTQALAEERVMVDKAQALTARDILDNGYTRVTTVEQCNQIANISKRTIKAAISGVPIAEVIEKFVYSDFTQFRDDSNLENITIADSAHHWDGQAAGAELSGVRLMEYHTTTPGHKIRAIYKTVDQIKTKYGQVRPQDIARLNNRAEQKLIECRKTAGTAEGMYIDDASSN